VPNTTIPPNPYPSRYVRATSSAVLHHPSPSLCKGVVLITGASRGIGSGIALRLADGGYDIVANGQTSTKELGIVVKKIEEKGRRALAIPGDVSEEEDIIKMIQDTVDTLGSLDVVRNSPSVFAGFDLCEMPC